VRIPSEDAFLDTLFEVRFGKKLTCPRCRQVGTFRRRHKQKAYSCVSCGLAAAELVHGFNASAKEIQRQTGVNYKTAWRMKKLLQELPAPSQGSTADLEGLVRWLISHSPP